MFSFTTLLSAFSSEMILRTNHLSLIKLNWQFMSEKNIFLPTCFVTDKMGAIFSSSLNLVRFFSQFLCLVIRCFRKSRHSNYQQLIFSPFTSLILEARAFRIFGLTLCAFAARHFHRIHRPFHTMTHQRYHRMPGLSIKKKRSDFQLPDLINATTKQL